MNVTTLSSTTLLCGLYYTSQNAYIITNLQFARGAAGENNLETTDIIFLDKWFNALGGHESSATVDAITAICEVIKPRQQFLLLNANSQAYKNIKPKLSQLVPPEGASIGTCQQCKCNILQGDEISMLILSIMHAIDKFCDIKQE